VADKDKDKDEDTTDGLDRKALAKLTAEGRSIPTLILITGPDTISRVFPLIEQRTIIGRSADCQVWLDEHSISRHHAHIDKFGDNYRLMDLDSKNGTLVNGQPARAHQLVEGDRIQIGLHTVIKFTYQDKLDAEFQRSLYDAATRDGLTNLHNRRFFLEMLSRELAHAERRGSELALLMIDIDHFKRVNDTHGHLIGDDVLRHISRTLEPTFRTNDTLARYGGEEFVVLIGDCPRTGVLVAAERTRALVQANPFVDADLHIELSVSVGVAMLSDGPIKTAEELLAAADKRLYAAKHAGRNRVVAE
jgi:diguanylate cyclase (GGDEF)-like protein